MPMIGCRIDAVIFIQKAIIPICAKLRANESLRIGKSAEILDCIESFNKWTMLIANNIGYTVTETGKALDIFCDKRYVPFLTSNRVMLE
jgi:hypothetical protein